MILAKVFNVCERATTQLVNILLDAGFSGDCVVSIDGLTTTRVPLVRDRDLNLGVKAMIGERITGSVSVSSIKYTFEVRPVLYTDIPFGPGKLKNGLDNQGKAVFYPEAYFTTSAGFTRTKAAVVGTSLRPAYQVVIGDIDSAAKHIILYGPGIEHNARYYASIKGNDGASNINVPLYVKDDSYPDPGLISFDEEVQETTVGKANNVSSIFLKYERGYVPFIFGQHILTIDGVPLSGVAVHRILQLVVYLESGGVRDNVKEVFTDSGIVIPLVRVGDYYRIDTSIDDVIVKATHTNVVVDNILGRVVGTDRSVLISDKDGRIAKLTSLDTTQTCFVFAFAYYITIAQGLTTVAFFELINQLMDRDIIAIEKDYVYGKATGKLELARLPLPYSRVDISDLKRVHVPFDQIKEGNLILFGYDPEENKRPGCEHYIVARKMNGKLIAVYDPLRIHPFEYGTDISELLNHTDVDCSVIALSPKVYGSVA